METTQKPLLYDLGWISPSSYFSYSSDKSTVFAPTKGVLVKNPASKGIIATCSAVVYLDLVIQSLKLLEDARPEVFAKEVGTAVNYADIVTEKLAASLEWQRKLLESAREIVVGVITADSEAYWAVGRKSVSRKKVSVEAKIRKLLPVGNWNIYRLNEEAMIYKVPAKASSGERTSVMVSELQGVQKAMPHIIIIADTPHYRKYAGRTLLANKDAWKGWLDSVPGNSRIFLHGPSGMTEYSPSELMKSTAKQLYPIPKNEDYTLAYSPIMYLFDMLKDEYPAGFTVTMYITAHMDGIYDFITFMNNYLAVGVNVKVKFMRFGSQALQAIRRLEWKLGYANSQELIYSFDNYRLKDMMLKVDPTWPSLRVGIGAKTNKFRAFRVKSHGSSLEEVASEFKVSPEGIFVQIKSDIDYKPPYLCTIRGETVVSNTDIKTLSYSGSVHGGIVTDTKVVLPVNTTIYKFTGDIGMLLAN